MRVGWHYLTDDDTSPPLGASTYLDVAGATAGSASAIQMCRPYFKGKPDLLALAQIANRFGAHIQFGNELNLPSEDYNGSPADYRADYHTFKRLVRNLVYWCPPSPGVEGWQSWLDGAEEADGIVLHCYGTLDEMKAVVIYTVLRFPGKPIWIGECNFGPATDKFVDLDQWAHEHFRPFLDWCAGVPEVEAVCYFAYKWPHPDIAMGTPVDGSGTAIETILREWRAPMAEDTRIQQLLDQNAIITAALIDFRHGRFEGADGMDGKIVALNGGVLPDGWAPSYPPKA